ncbi:hypothetical protein [Arthrobacter sp. STN4]|nr:hypothetical protein [Arthrobacter sp. STN4]MCQ9163676.1 hypothetical protein [Arthrobacter sp. STN4]
MGMRRRRRTSQRGVYYKERSRLWEYLLLGLLAVAAGAMTLYAYLQR